MMIDMQTFIKNGGADNELSDLIQVIKSRQDILKDKQTYEWNRIFNDTYRGVKFIIDKKRRPNDDGYEYFCTFQQGNNIHKSDIFRLDQNYSLGGHVQIIPFLMTFLDATVSISNPQPSWLKEFHEQQKAERERKKREYFNSYPSWARESYKRDMTKIEQFLSTGKSMTDER